MVSGSHSKARVKRAFLIVATVKVEFAAVGVRLRCARLHPSKLLYPLARYSCRRDRAGRPPGQGRLERRDGEV